MLDRAEYFGVKPQHRKLLGKGEIPGIPDFLHLLAPQLVFTLLSGDVFRCGNHSAGRRIPGVRTAEQTVFALLNQPCRLCFVIAGQCFRFKGQYQLLFCPGRQQICLSKRHKALIRLSKAGASGGGIELHHFLTGTIPGVFDKDVDADPASVQLGVLYAQRKGRIGKPIAEGVQHRLSQRIEPAIPYKDALFVIRVKLFSKSISAWIIRIPNCPGCRKSAGGVHFARQHCGDRIAAANAALSHKDNCTGQVFHRGQFHYTAHIQKQDEFLILTCQ